MAVALETKTANGRSCSHADNERAAAGDVTPTKRVDHSRGQPVRCVRAIRSLPPDAYRLESDGRKRLSVAKDRRAVAVQLATYANGDGSSVTVGIERLSLELGMPRRTLYRRISELKALGYLKNEGLVKEHGTARRRLILPELKTPEPSPGELPDSKPGAPVSPPTSTRQVCQIEQAGVPDRQAGVPDMSGRQPSVCTDPRTARTATSYLDGGLGMIQSQTLPQRKTPSQRREILSRANSEIRLRKCEAIRAAYEKDVEEHNFAEFLKECTDEVRDHYNSLWKQFKRLFPEWKKPKKRTSEAFGCTLLECLADWLLRIQSEELTRGIFCCKVIDQLVEDGDRFDPDFGGLRDRLREDERRCAGSAPLPS
jgi:hypothetical protein